MTFANESEANKVLSRNPKRFRFEMEALLTGTRSTLALNLLGIEKADSKYSGAESFGQPSGDRGFVPSGPIR